MERVQPLRHKMKEQARSKTIDCPTAPLKFRPLPELWQSRGANFRLIYSRNVKGNDDGDTTGTTMW